MMHAVSYAVIAAAAAALGVVTGLFGFDGGAFLFPILLYFGFTRKQTVAILLFLNTIPNTAPTLWMYHREGHLLWAPAVAVAAVTTAGIWLGGSLGLRDVFTDAQLSRFQTAVFGAAAVLTAFSGAK